MSCVSIILIIDSLYYLGGEWAERGVAIVVHKSIVRSVVKNMVCNDRIIAGSDCWIWGPVPPLLE